MMVNVGKFCICIRVEENDQELTQLPYFLGYKTDFISFQNNPKDLDPSYKTDLDL